MGTSRPTLILAIASVCCIVACGGNAELLTVAGAEAPAAPPPPAGQVLDNSLMTATVPAAWDIVDHSEKLSMVTLAKKGSGGAVGVYLKVEGSGNWDGTPQQAIADFAQSKGGSAPETTTINGTEWVHTTYQAFGSKQTMMVTKKNGNKITATVLGDDYSASPDVRMILDSLVLK